MMKALKPLAVIAFILAAAILVGGTFYVLSKGHKTEQAAESAAEEEATDNNAAAALEAVQEEWGINLDELDDRFEKFGTKFLDSSMPWQDKARANATGLKTGAFDFPLDKWEGDEPTANMAEEDREALEAEIDQFYLEQVEERIRRNPVYGDAVVQAMVKMDIDGFKFTEINGWLEECKSYLDTGFETDGVAAFLEGSDEDGDGKIGRDELYVTEEYVYYMDGILTWLELAANEGLQDNLKSSHNWILNLAPKANSRRAMENTKQESEQCLLLWFGDSKTNSVWAKLGFNVKDGRPELFSKAVVPKKKENPPAKKQDPPPEDNKKKDNGGNKGGGGGGKPEDGKGAKDKAADPQNTGNAPYYSGGNDNPGPGSVESKDQTTKPDDQKSDGENKTIISQPGGNSGYNSGAGPTGTSDTTGDVEQKDEGREVQGTDNDKPKETGTITNDPGTGGSFTDQNTGNKTENSGSGADTGKNSETTNGTVNPFAN